MALDVYVMPLWRFKAGDFESPIEAVLETKPTVIPLAAPLSPPRPPWYLRALARLGIIQFIPPAPPSTPEERRALTVQEVNDLKVHLTALTGIPVDWPDEGGVHYNK